MGNKQSKNSQKTPLIPKTDKAVNDEKLLKIGLGLGRGDLRVEGNFQMGWHRRCVKSYGNPVAEEPEVVVDETETIEDSQV